MKKKFIGYIQEDEKDEIRKRFFRKMALKELLNGLSSVNLNEDEYNLYYKKIIKDFAEADRKYNQWWYEIPKKYNWSEYKNLHVEFDTNEIFQFIK